MCEQVFHVHLSTFWPLVLLPPKGSWPGDREGLASCIPVCRQVLSVIRTSGPGPELIILVFTPLLLAEKSQSLFPLSRSENEALPSSPPFQGPQAQTLCKNKQTDKIQGVVSLALTGESESLQSICSPPVLPALNSALRVSLTQISKSSGWTAGCLHGLAKSTKRKTPYKTLATQGGLCFTLSALGSSSLQDCKFQGWP